MLPHRLVWLAGASAIWLATGTAGLTAPADPAPASKADPKATQADDEDDAPTPAPLTVGSMAIASDADLKVESMALDVSLGKVVYAYAFHNKGKAKIALAASVALPDLEVNNEGNSEYDLPSQSAENPVELAVSIDGKPVATQPNLQAIALGIDRLADLKTAQMPLIPFGDAIDKAIASAKPETLTRLQNLGLLTPRDPSQPDTSSIADWSLRVVHGWTITIDPGATSQVQIGFAPVTATYTIDSQSLAGFDALKEQVCLTPQVLAATKALFKSKDAVATVVDITLANEGPARWLDNPSATIAVHKPKPDSIVVFCGMDAATTAQPVVNGKISDSKEAQGLRVLVFSSGMQR